MTASYSQLEITIALLAGLLGLIDFLVGNQFFPVEVLVGDPVAHLCVLTRTYAHLFAHIPTYSHLFAPIRTYLRLLQATNQLVGCLQASNQLIGCLQAANQLDWTFTTRAKLTTTPARMPATTSMKPHRPANKAIVISNWLYDAVIPK